MKCLLFIILFLCISATNCGQITLIGSYFVPTESPYRVLLNGNNLDKHSIINVTFKTSNYEKYITYNSEAILKSGDGSISREILFSLPNISQPNYDLKIVHKNTTSNTCTQQSVRLINISYRPIILIELQKQTFILGEKVKFRIFVLTQKLVPYVNFKEMNVIILDGCDNTVKTFSNVRTNEYGMFEDTQDIFLLHKPGRWTIQVKVDEKKRSKSFLVSKIDKNSIQINLSVPKVVLFDEAGFDIRIIGKHPKESFFKSPINVTATEVSVSDESKVVDKKFTSIYLTNTREVIHINLDKQLDIQSMKNDINLKITVSFVDPTSNINPNVTTQILISNKKHRPVIKLLSKNYFKPGFVYPLKLSIKTHDNKPYTFSDSIKLFLEYHNGGSVDDDEINSQLTKGITSENLGTSIHTAKIKIRIKIEEIEESFIVLSVPVSGKKEYMQATFLNKGQKPGETINIDAESTGSMTTLYVIVTGQYGIVYSKIYKNASGSKKFTFSIKLIDSMSPESNIIVYYFRKEDGVIIFDVLNLKIKFVVENLVELSTIDYARPRDSKHFKIKTRKDSLVIIKAFDQFSNLKNEILKSDVYNELIAYKFIDFKDLTRNEFKNFSSFVLKPLNGVECSDEDTLADSTFEDNFENSQIEDYIENLSSNYFPEIWFDEIIKAESEHFELEKKTPDKYLTWKVHGFSIHPTKGLSIVDYQPTITVSNAFGIKIYSPNSIFEGEIVKVLFSVMRFYENKIKTTNIITLENAEFMEKSGNSFKVSSNKFKMTTSAQISVEQFYDDSSFYIRSMKSEDLKIKIESNFESFDDEAEQIIRVENSSKTEMVALSSHLIDLSGGSYVKNIELKVPKDVKIYAKIYGNIFGFGKKKMDGKVLTLQYDEYIADKFLSNVIAFKYSKFINSVLNSQKYHNDMIHNYHDAILVLQNLLAQNNPANIRLVGYFTKTLILSSSDIKIDENLFKECLDFIQKYQKIDGSFPYNSDSNLHINFGSEAAQPFIFTALIISAFMTDENTKLKYEFEIQKSIEYLKSNLDVLSKDYEKSVVAYVFALHEDRETVDKLLQSIKLSSLNSKPPAISIEIVSFLILAKILISLDPSKEFEFLVERREIDRKFWATYSTSLALEAIYEYNKYKNFNVSNFEFKIGFKSVRIADQFDEKILELTDNKLSMRATGVGIGYAVVYYETSPENKMQNHNFKISKLITEIAESKIQLKLSISFVSKILTKLSNMVVVELNLPRGFIYIDHAENHNILSTELKNDKNCVIFLIKKMEKSKNYDFLVNAIEVYEIHNQLESKVRVFDYYMPDIESSTEYKYEKKHREKKDPGSQDSFVTRIINKLF